ncbi:MAG TPA: hypothetical protein VK437_08935 [Steroidobacteraceae bacterium]|nr:hypothetical protein [Steroidobacteraceae bacterium]
MLALHMRLAILFALAGLAVLGYFWKMPHMPLRTPSGVAARDASATPDAASAASTPPSTAQPVYIETLPSKNTH